MKITVMQIVFALALAIGSCIVILRDESLSGRKPQSRSVGFLLLLCVPWWTGTVFFATYFFGLVTAGWRLALAR